ncbi:MAG: cell division protein SepF [Dethiobacter sp.]|nr:cell division protein SepF [Dethiobacter sp.]
MAKLWEKLLSFFGLMEDTEEESLEEVDFVRTPARKAAVLNLHSSKNMRLVIVKPYEFAEAQQIVENIKARKPVLVNLEETEISEARRIVDFISGATYALDGNMQKVSQQIFVFAPSQVEVNAQVYRSLQERETATTLEE